MKTNVLALLQSKRLKATPARVKILSVLDQAEGARMSAESIYRETLKSDEVVSLASVYRVLKELNEQDVVQRSWCNESDDVRFVYFINHDNAGRIKPELFCVSCYRSMVLELPLLREELNRLAAARGLRPHNRPIEILVTCDECAGTR